MPGHILLCAKRRLTITAQQQALPLAEREAECCRELRLVRVAVAVAVGLVVGRRAELACLELGFGLGLGRKVKSER